jgi:hypothetical protein
MHPLIHLKRATSLSLTVLGFVWIALLPNAQAVSPAPDGGYPGGNTAEGQAALLSLTTGGYNTAVGFFSLRSNSTGPFNTAIGAGALLANTADNNTATGAGALLSNTTGSQNTANGVFALFSNTTGSANTAAGYHALIENTFGGNDTAIGAFALFSNTTGSNNTAIGDAALDFNTTGVQNTADGAAALLGNTTGNSNTASGYSALRSNATGNNNTANGYQALFSNTTSDLNTATGYQALFSNTTGTSNTADGYQALANNTTGSFNVALTGGFNLTTGDFNIDIGNDGIAGEAGVIRIGSGCCQSSAFIAGIWGIIASGGTPVYINSDGQLGTATSSQRFKDDIKPMDASSELILRLKPVTFRYKREIDPRAIPQFGLVAEEVEKVNPDLVVRDQEGKPYTVRYDAVNAMLLNEFLKEHKTVREQGATIAELKKQIEALTASLQKVSAQLEVSKPAPQTVLNDQ